MDEDEPTERYVAVQHCLLVRRGTTDESWRVRGDSGEGPYALRGVSYRYRVASNGPFPATAEPPWAVYLRITGANAGPTRVLFRVHYRNSSGRWDHLDRREMDRAIALPTVGEGTRDVVLNLPFLRVGGHGLHAVSLHFWYDGVELDTDRQFRADAPDEPPPWESEPEELFGTSDWTFAAVEYFWIEGPP